MRKAITVKAVKALKPGDMIADDELRGFVVRKLPSGTTSYGYRYRDRHTGARRWIKIGPLGITPDQARTEAKRLAGQVADRRDPLAEHRDERKKASKAAGSLFRKVAERFIERHAKRNNRRWAEVERILTKYVTPAWGDRHIGSITRRDVVELLDAIEDRKLAHPEEAGRKLGGPVMADRTLAAIRKLFNWFAAQGDHDFRPPIVRGMARTKPKERARDRVLSDEELSAFWQATEGNRLGAVFGAAVRFMLLSAQRPGECLALRRGDIDAEGTWTIDASEYKTKKSHWVPLSQAARAIVDGQPKHAKGDYVFTTLGDRPFSGDTKAKRRLDKELLVELRKLASECGTTEADQRKIALPRWTLHDLRRTARSLMSRAGVRPDIAERVLGHVIPGVAGIYDRYSYSDEKRAALEALAALVERIAAGKTAEVVPLRKTAPSG